MATDWTNVRHGVEVRALVAQMKLPLPTPEYRFAPPRRWRFDFCWVEQRVALEVDGGAWSGGRHTRGKGFLADQEKRNAAVVLGWRVLHCTPQTLTSGMAAVAQVLGQGEAA